MAKLIMFLSLMIGFMCVMIIGSYKNKPITNEKFDIVKAEKEYQEKMVLLASSNSHHDLTMEAGEEEVQEAAVPAAISIVLDTEELKNGHQIYTKKGQCVTCHGLNGEGKKSQLAPKIAGQYSWYLYEQLVNMKNKVRINKKMDAYLKNLSEKDFQDVATYLSKLPY